MTDKDLIRNFLDQIIVLRKGIDRYNDMREECFFRLDQMELDFDSEKYDDYRLIISECDYQIEQSEDMIEQLWFRIDELGGVDLVLEETLAQDIE